MKLNYCIGGHYLGIDTNEVLVSETFLPTFIPFLCNRAVDSSLLLELKTGQVVENTSELITNFDWEDTNCQISKIPTGYVVELTCVRNGLKGRMQSADNWSRIQTSICCDMPQADYFLSFFLMMAYSFAAAPHQTLMMHASVIRMADQGLLFLGKSGTGKSTHSALWIKHHIDSSLLNDDNPVVRLLPDGSVWVYGSPWSGKTPCYRNEQVPVTAFVRLNQAPENKMTRLPAAQAFAALLPSCSNMIWDKPIHDHICQTIAAIVPKVTVCNLACLPDSAAVDLSFSLLKPAIDA